MKRTIGGWALTVLGLACAFIGLALAILLGPDGRRMTGPHEVPVDGSVLVTGPKALRWVNVRVDVLVEVPASKPVFVGMANSVDVEDYVKGVQHVEIEQFSTPWKPQLREVTGEQPTVRGAPTALEWWLKDSAGLGGASLSVTLPDEPVSIAVVAIGASNLSGLEVTMAYGIKGGFFKGIGLLLAGLGAALAGRMIRRGDHALEEGFTDDEDDVLYVFVDDDGVEHVLSEDEVASGEFDVVDEVAGSEPDPEAEPEVTAVVPDVVDVPGVGASEGDRETSYVLVDDDGVEHVLSKDEVASGEFEVVDEVLVPDGESEPEPDADPEEDEVQSGVDEQGVADPGTDSDPAPIYVWVDDDGVEHELTEAEVAELGDEVEIVDEPQEDR